MADLAVRLPDLHTSKAFSVVCSSVDRESWLQARRTGIGASEAGVLAGALRWDSPLSLYARKLGLMPEKDETEAMYWGRQLEPIIVEEYRRRTGRLAVLSNVLLRSKRYPFLLSTLDAWTSDDGERWWPLEVKAPGAHQADDWIDGAPDYYEAQAQQQTLVTGSKRATFAGLIGGQRFVWCDTEPDKILQRKIAYQGKCLWQHIEDREPPPVDDTEHTETALKYLYPDNGQHQLVTLPPEFDDLDAERADLKAQAKEHGARIKEIDSTIKGWLGENGATAGVLSDGSGMYRWQREGSGSVSWKSLAERCLENGEVPTPDLVAQFRGAPSKVFRRMKGPKVD